jgi:hypothetical protein
MQPMTLVQEDWTRFLTPEGLAEKSGVPRSNFCFMILKELTDNACDTGGATIVAHGDDNVIITDTGPGVDLDAFSIKRPMVSSKHWRTGKRGALGNGLRAVMGALYCLDGYLDVETLGSVTRLRMTDNGDVTHEQLGSSDRNGTRLNVHCPCIAYAVDFAETATYHKGDSITAPRPSPNWFDVDAIRDLQRSAEGVSLKNFVAQFGTRYKPGKGISADSDPHLLLMNMQAEAMREPKVRPLGDVYGGVYVKEAGTHDVGDATLPIVIEVWAWADLAGKGHIGKMDINRPVINRSQSLTGLNIQRGSKGRLQMTNAGDLFGLPKDARDNHTLRPTVNYQFTIAITTPYVPIISSGKAPDLYDMIPLILRCVGKAGRKAHNGLARQTKGMTIKDAVRQLLPEAYKNVSEGGRYWANARQLMYEMRPDILRMCDIKSFGDKNVTQVCIPEFLVDNPELTANWRIAYDKRGSLIEPHTGTTVGLGTVEVAGYTERRRDIIFDRPVASVGLVHWANPEHRFKGLLFVEKEGFNELLTESGILERYDLALASTKGMSVIAARQLIDEMAGRSDDFKVYTVADFDITGQSIRYTLTHDTERYQFKNRVTVKHLGVDWEQAQALHEAGRSEPVEGDMSERAELLNERSLLPETAIQFLTGGYLFGGEPRRVEVNALRPKEFLQMIRDGIGEPDKLIPPDHVLSSAWQELSIRAQLRKLEADLRGGDAPEVPDDLRFSVTINLHETPNRSWDQAVLSLIEAGGTE